MRCFHCFLLQAIPHLRMMIALAESGSLRSLAKTAKNGE
jgi:hypothetical protein